MALCPNAETTADHGSFKVPRRRPLRGRPRRRLRSRLPVEQGALEGQGNPGTPIFVISGRGWGHGVGMAQWGAYGFAKQGATYDEILAHYYRGTTLGPAGVSRVRVLLAQGAPS